MFNKKLKDRVSNLERKLKISDYSVGIPDFYEEFSYKSYIKEIRNIHKEIERSEFRVMSKIEELRNFLGVEIYKPDCTPYLRKKPEDTKHSEEI